MKRFTAILLCAVATLTAATSAAQEHKIPFNGEVTDGAGKAIRTARVWHRSERDYALTDRAGRFGLTDVGPSDTLRILVKKRCYAIPVEGRRSMRIRLFDETQAAAEEAPEFVSLGYGFVARRERTNATNYISGEDLRRSGFTDILSALQGRVPGLDITGRGLQGGDGMQLTMRGTRSFKADSTPAFVVDGVIVPSFEGINLNDVDYVEVMKEATVYGSNGANGAILVHTKTAVR